jgi:hypothetical protein
MKTYAYMHFAVYEVSTGNTAAPERAKILLTIVTYYGATQMQFAF